MNLNSEAPWVIKEDGLYSNGMHEKKYNHLYAHLLFEEVCLSGATVYTLIKMVKDFPQFYHILSDNNRLETLVNYLNFIDWEKNKHLFYEKFGQLDVKDNYILLSPTTFWDEEKKVFFKEISLSMNLIQSNKKESIFGERIEKILDLPLVYNGHLSDLCLKKKRDNIDIVVYEPLVLGRLLNTVFNEVFSLMEGSSLVDDKFKYLPNKSI